MKGFNNILGFHSENDTICFQSDNTNNADNRRILSSGVLKEDRKGIISIRSNRFQNDLDEVGLSILLWGVVDRLTYVPETKINVERLMINVLKSI